MNDYIFINVLFLVILFSYISSIVITKINKYKERKKVDKVEKYKQSQDMPLYFDVSKIEKPLLDKLLIFFLRKHIKYNILNNELTLYIDKKIDFHPIKYGYYGIFLILKFNDNFEDWIIEDFKNDKEIEFITEILDWMNIKYSYIGENLQIYTKSYKRNYLLSKKLERIKEKIKENPQS